MSARALLRWLPLALGVAAAVLLVASGMNGELRIGLPLATIAVAVGVLATAVLLLAARARTRRRAAAEQAATAAALREREAHRRFLARLDHELKNPLTAIRSALATHAVAPEPEHLRIAVTQADRLASLVGELRALASLETRPIERARVDLAAVVDEEAAALRDELTAHGAARDIAVALPTAPWPLPAVDGDRDLLAIAVRNLLVNAAKYSTADSRIEIRGAEEDGVVAIEVADTGIGIRAEDLPHVWDELWRGEGARGAEGSGLGLVLVRVVAARHGGHVAIRSQPGIGTSVTMRIPRAAG